MSVSMSSLGYFSDHHVLSSFIVDLSRGLHARSQEAKTEVVQFPCSVRGSCGSRLSYCSYLTFVSRSRLKKKEGSESRRIFPFQTIIRCSTRWGTKPLGMMIAVAAASSGAPDPGHPKTNETSPHPKFLRPLDLWDKCEEGSDLEYWKRSAPLQRHASRRAVS